MKCEVLEKSDIVRVKSFIPKELYPLLGSRKVRIIGAFLFGEPMGALVWEPHMDGTGLIRSIYIDPPGRRIGLGRMLMTELLMDMAGCNVYKCDLYFSPIADRAKLLPFFADMNVAVDTYDYPYGIQFLGNINDALISNRGIYREHTGCYIAGLSKSQKRCVAKWLYDVFGESLSPYEADQPPSFAVIDGDIVQAALLLSEKADGILSIDYLFQKKRNPKELMGLIGNALNAVKNSYAMDTLVSMLLISKESEMLYEGLFGKTDKRMTVCKGIMDITKAYFED